MRVIEVQFYSVEDVCKLLGLSRATVDRMTKRGEIPGRRHIGWKVKYHKATIDQWIGSGERVEVSSWR